MNIEASDIDHACVKRLRFYLQTPPARVWEAIERELENASTRPNTGHSSTRHQRKEKFHPSAN